MNKPSLRDLKSKIRLIGRDCSQHEHLDRAALPPRFSHPKKPVTMAVSVLFSKCNSTWAERLAAAIRQYTELAGIVPFDWEDISPVPEAFKSEMRRPDDKFYIVYLGFDTTQQAQETKAKFSAIKCHIDIWTEEDEHERLQDHLEQIEKESDERPTYDGGDGRGEMYWRDHPFFQEGWRDYLACKTPRAMGVLGLRPRPTVSTSR
jgi:hypothetical protein